MSLQGDAVGENVTEAAEVCGDGEEQSPPPKRARAEEPEAQPDNAAPTPPEPAPPVYTEDNPPPPPPGSPSGTPAIDAEPALQRITTHIQSPAKLGKAVALVQKLLASESCRPRHACMLLQVVDASLNTEAWAEPASRREYRRLFKALDEHSSLFDDAQRSHLDVYRMRAITRNALIGTDDSFMFNKLIGEIKGLLRKSPEVDPEYNGHVYSELKSRMSELRGGGYQGDQSLVTWSAEEADLMMKDAILDCLDAVREHCYHKQWARTSVDLAMLDAWEQMSKFCGSQRERVRGFKVFVTEQRAKRKQGLSAKDAGTYTTAFEQARSAWSTSKVSHRGNVGGGGDHKTETWLG